MGELGKKLVWVGSSKKDLLELPLDVRKFFGHALDFAQRNARHGAAKPLKSFSGVSVLELVEDDVGDSCRALYAIKFSEAVFVLHSVQKKSKTEIAASKEDVDSICARLNVALVKELNKKRIIPENVEVEISSGNAFADLGLRSAKKLQFKSALATEITRAIRRFGMSQEEASKRMGIPRSRVLAMMRGDFKNLSERKLMECLKRLGYDIEIRARRTDEEVGQMKFVFS